MELILLTEEDKVITSMEFTEEAWADVEVAALKRADTVEEGIRLLLREIIMNHKG